MGKVILYTTHCPKCSVLKKKLDDLGAVYDEIDDVDEMVKLGIKSAPVLSVSGDLLDFKQALNWIKCQEVGY